jgi:hypothetical protein
MIIITTLLSLKPEHPPPRRHHRGRPVPQGTVEIEKGTKR